ncbi:MAG: DNA gyrase inhibitor YacG [Betaproteobacteria bacterium]
MTARLVNCPHCQRKVAWSTDNAWRPFCSERCKLTDLGAWANESYRIPAVELDDIDEEEVEKLNLISKN